MATITTAQSPSTWRHCDVCYEVTYASRNDKFVVCDDCKFDQGEAVDANIGEGSWTDSNTQWITGVLMTPWSPGDDLLLDVHGRRVYYESKRVFSVRRAAPATGGF